jgi:hypothetical protein
VLSELNETQILLLSWRSDLLTDLVVREPYVSESIERRAGAPPVGRRVTYWRRFSSIGLDSHLR